MLLQKALLSIVRYYVDQPSKFVIASGESVPKRFAVPAKDLMKIADKLRNDKYKKQASVERSL